MEIKKRESYIDVLKGIGITFVVFGHVTHNGYLREYIWDFHMPLFFWISGLLFNRSKYSTFKAFALHRINTIVLPYIVFFCTTFLYYLFIERHFRGGEYSIAHQLFGLIYGTYEGDHLYFNGALWFLPCLFSVELLFWMVSGVKNIAGMTGLLISCFVLGSILYINGLNLLPWGIHTAFFAIVFYGAGYLSKQSVKNLNATSSLTGKTLLMAGCFLAQLFCIGRYTGGSIATATLPYIPLAMFGISLYLTLSIVIGSNKLLEFLGRNSIVILAFQEQLYRAIIYAFGRIFSLDIETVRSNLLLSIIITLLTLASIYPFIYLYNRFVKKRLNVF